MAYVNVDHSKLEKAAQEVDSFITTLKAKMKTAKTEVDTMGSSWQGADAVQFQQQWAKLTESNSTYDQLIKALEDYAKFLRYAANQYKDAQTDAINSANWLPKY